MGQTRVHRLAFNRGIVSRLGVARADIKRLAWACTIMTNWMTRVLGSMMLRPGTGYIGGIYADHAAKMVPHIFAIDDCSLIEFTDSIMRVWINDVVLTRVAVSTAVTTAWTNSSSTAGSVGPFVAVSVGVIRLNGNAGDPARATQTVAVAVADRNVEHALRIVVVRGPTILKVGTALGDDSYVTTTSLDTGTHSIAFTPTGDFVVEFQNPDAQDVYVGPISIEAAGVVTLPSPYLAADLDNLRHDQSGDVVFVGDGRQQQRVIERRGTRPAARSWSIALYKPNDGPFRNPNVGNATMSVTAAGAGAPGFGNNVLSTGQPFFRTSHVGALFKLIIPQQGARLYETADGQATDAIHVTGVSTERDVTITITGLTATGNSVYLQRAFAEDGPYSIIATYTADQSITYNDTFDNSDFWYRLAFARGSGPTWGTYLDLHCGFGETEFIARVTSYINSTSVNSEIVSGHVPWPGTGSVFTTTLWYEGQWSDFRGWPGGVAFNEGRLCWAGKDSMVESVSDAFYSFDANTEGDSGPINRTIGSGPVDTINWLLPLQRLIAGAEGAEFSVRSSSLDEIVTPTNFNMKRASNQGSAAVQGVVVDQNGVYVQRGGTRLFILEFGNDGIDYNSNHLSALCPEIGQPGVIRMAVQRQPDTRLHCIRSDGTAFVLVFDKTEQVTCFLNIDSTGMQGLIEDVVVLPGGVGDEEDFVYYVVKRTGSNGVVHRFLEKWAFEDECRGDTINKLADCHVTYSGVPTSTISAPHLFNENVVVWADGADIGTQDDYTQQYTLNSSGELHLDNPVTSYVVGLAYSAPWQSSRFGETMAGGDGALTSTSKINGISMILADVHNKGLRFGQSLDTTKMDDLPQVGEEGEVIAADTVREDYTLEPSAFPGTWSNNTRLCLLAQAPRPVTVLATPLEIEYHG